jgi:hypothetical protein
MGTDDGNHYGYGYGYGLRRRLPAGTEMETATARKIVSSSL